MNKKQQLIEAIRVFNLIIEDKTLLNYDNKFICLLIIDLSTKDSIVSEILHKHEPNNTQYTNYTKGKYWTGSLSWWNVCIATKENNLNRLFNTKRRYLKEVVANLEQELQSL